MKRNCAICRNPIAPKRVAALPGVDTCIECADTKPVFAAPNPRDESGTDFVIVPGHLREKARTYFAGTVSGEA